MTSREFVIWLKGFTEACNDFTATPKQWDRIKEVLNEVEDCDDDPGLDEEIDDWYPDSIIPFRPSANLFPPNGTPPIGTINTQGGTITFTTGSSNTSISNFPSGTSITYTTKQQLND